jgi:hypothetical protein
MVIDALTTITSFRWTSILIRFIKEYVYSIGSSQSKKKLKNQDERKEKKEEKKIYTPFSWFVLISGTGLVLACRSDSESYYGFGS